MKVYRFNSTLRVTPRPYQHGRQGGGDRSRKVVSSAGTKYPSAKAAAIALGKSPAAVSIAIRHHHLCAGLTWRYWGSDQ